MATEKQIEANRRNAARSTGPKTEAGKARSRANATIHGLAGAWSGDETDLSPEFTDRRAKWAAEHRPMGDSANWALDRAVAASLRIDRCERAVEHLISESQKRAELAWDEDRAVEAATIAARLARDPLLASRQLQASLAGVVLLIEAWLGLLSALEVGDWSESDASKALDLLGVDASLRAGQTVIDSPEGTDPVAYRRELAFDELERLETLRDQAMAPLDEADRRRALRGDIALLSKPVKLMLRYERDAWKRYRESMKQLESHSPPPASTPSPRPVVATRLSPPEEAATDPILPIEADDEDAWLDQLERQIETLFASERGRDVVTERTQFEGVAIGRDS